MKAVSNESGTGAPDVMMSLWQVLGTQPSFVHEVNYFRNKRDTGIELSPPTQGHSIHFRKYHRRKETICLRNAKKF